MLRWIIWRTAAILVSAGLAASWSAGSAHAQSRIKSLPGYDAYARMEPELADAIGWGAVKPDWDASGRSFEFDAGERRFRFDIQRLRMRDVGEAKPEKKEEPKPRLVLARGRGAEADVRSPDGRWRAFTRDMNLFVEPVGGGEARNISGDGGPESRVRHGVGSYVYLEEFAMRSPVWWAPDSRRIAWLRFDEAKVEDYFLPLDQIGVFSRVHTQAYPHPGRPNPVADLMVHDFDTGRTLRMDVREGQPFGDEVVGHYVWDGAWTKDGTEILVFRSNRLQTVQDLAACDPGAGSCRSVVAEQRPSSWAEVSPPVFLSDGRRFVWASERSGYRNFYLYSLDDGLIGALTRHAFEVQDVVLADERRGLFWYTARSGDNHLKAQLHRVKFDGTDDQRLTDPAYHHSIDMAPGGRHWLDVAERHDEPPTTTLHDASGRKLAEIAMSDLTRFHELGLRTAESFTYTSADGGSLLHGLIQKPSHFDPSKKYPVLFSIYGAPGTNGASESFQRPSAVAELGFLIVKLDARTAAGRGRAFLDRVHKQIGPMEVDDFAAAARSLSGRPYVDRDRIGIFGTSYGGTASALALLRHPDVFAAAAASSPVTDFRLYDTAYSERYLGLPETDAEAYDRIEILNRAASLDGDLLIFFGTSDDNVHPKNSLALIDRLQQAGKSFEVQVGPDLGHTSVNTLRMMEFFIDSLVLDQGPQ